MTKIVKGKSNCKVVTDVDVEKLTQLYVQIMNAA
jgi:hypothetical protein